MSNIDCLIFSKDRPAQLDLLLRSIDRHALHLYSGMTMTILVRSTDPIYSAGYDLCQEKQAQFFQEETDFEADVRDWLDRAGEIISFLVDDDVFYRDASEPLELPWSYRGGDYDYPFSLDGNVYAKADIVKLLDGLHFRNPTELEAFGHTHRKRLPFTEVAHGEPCLVGIPANRVSVSSGMPHMGVDLEMLNSRYLAGERLALPEPLGHTWAAHANLPLVFG